MIKRKPSNHNLRNKKFQFIDTNQVSKDFFRVDLPEKFYIGKNSFTIKPTDNLLKGSQIQIDILDSNGNPLYYEVTNIINESSSRIIVLYIYPDTPFGEITLYIAGTSKINSSVLWKREMQFSFIATSERPIFTSAPKIQISEKFIEVKSQPISRLKTLNNNNKLLSIYKNQPSDTDLFKLTDNYIEPISFIPTQDITRYISSSDSQFFQQFTTTSSFAANRDIIPINSLNYDTIYVTSSFFSSSMVGGIIEFDLNQYILDNFSLSHIPRHIQETLKNNSKYTSSIVDVIDDTRIKIYPNFSFKLKHTTTTYFTLDSLVNFTNFTASYFESNETGSIVHPNALQSFVHCEIRDLEPISGYVEAIDVYYKRYNFIGEYTNLGTVYLEPTDLFVNPSLYQTVNSKLGYKRYGLPYYPSDVETNWTSSIVGNISSSNFDFRDGTSNTGIISLNHTKIYDTNSYIKLFTTSSYDFISTKNGQYTINFNYEFSKNDDIPTPQLDIYLSGSSVQKSNSRSNINEIDGLGTYIGSVTDIKNINTANFEFITNDSLSNKVYFIIRSGHWKLRDIKIMSTHEPGFNLNHFYFLLPIPFYHGKNTTDCTDEIMFKFKYRNKQNYSNIETNINGLIFSGSI